MHLWSIKNHTTIAAMLMQVIFCHLNKRHEVLSALFCLQNALCVQISWHAADTVYKCYDLNSDLLTINEHGIIVKSTII